MPIDDLGAQLTLPRPPARVVSLVPSLTEAIAAEHRYLLAGATDWCTHPRGLDVPRYRGTKNPDTAALIAAAPDLVIANQEENRELDVRRLRSAGVPVWVTRIETLAESFSSMRRLFEQALMVPVPDWLPRAEASWAQPTETRLSVVTAIWRDPWMVVGGRTFSNDLLARLGCRNPFEQHAERYPHTDVAGIEATRPDLILLPDEPYAFSASDGPEAFAPGTARLISGRALTWYGPSLVTARRQIEAALAG
ncbi:MAG TPA: helical backbone metal receptor [Jatrophihabitans sp.]|nr:helical backbone metal receptor [Jatrophihabitans sp.]